MYMRLAAKRKSDDSESAGDTSELEDEAVASDSDASRSPLSMRAARGCDRSAVLCKAPREREHAVDKRSMTSAA